MLRLLCEENNEYLLLILWTTWLQFLHNKEWTPWTNITHVNIGYASVYCTFVHKLRIDGKQDSQEKLFETKHVIHCSLCLPSSLFWMKDMIFLPNNGNQLLCSSLCLSTGPPCHWHVMIGLDDIHLRNDYHPLCCISCQECNILVITHILRSIWIAEKSLWDTWKRQVGASSEKCVASWLHKSSESRYDDDASLCIAVAHESLGVTHTKHIATHRTWHTNNIGCRALWSE